MRVLSHSCSAVLRAALQLTIWLIFALLTACSAEEEASPRNPLPADRLIRVITSVNQPGTRAGATSDNLKEFGLFITNLSNSAYSYPNVYMNKEESDGSWQGYQDVDKNPLDAPMTWMDQRSYVDVIAYSPYKKGAKVNVGDIPDSVRTDQSLPENVLASDYLQAYASFSPTSSSQENDIYYDPAQAAMVITLNHRLSKLRVNLRYIDGVAEGATLQSATLEGTNVDYETELGSGIIKAPKTLRVANITMAQEEASTPDYDVTCEAIVVPQTVSFSLRLKVGNQEYVYSHPTSLAFESGKLYTLNLTVGKKETKNDSGSISTKAWTEQTGGYKFTNR